MSGKEQLVLPFPGPFPPGPFPATAFPAVEEGEAVVRNDGCGAANERHEGGVEPPTAKAQPIPQSRRELALAIFAQCDPVALGRALLQNGEDRGASVRLRSLEMFTEWAYGKGEPEAAPTRTRVIWDLPRRGESRDEGNGLEPESAEGGQK